MEYQEQLYSEWRSSTAKVFWGIVLASVFSIFSNFYDMVSWIGSLGEMIYEHSQTGETSIFNSKFFWIGVGAKMLIIIGYVLYIVGLTQFAQIQQKGSTAHYVYKARTSVILLIITCVISIIFGFVSNIPFIGVFFVFVIWLMYVITYFIMKHAYDGMMKADDFGGRAKLGAKNVRYAAVCQLRLLFMPLVILVVALLYVLIAGASIYGMREELARMAMRDSGILEGGAIMIVLPALVMGVVAIICAIVWAICSFIWPMMGWYRIMSDGPADVMILVQQNQSDDEPISEMQTVIQNNNINPTLKLDNEPPLTTDAFPLKSNNELAGSPQKKWYYIGGGLLVALLVGILSLFLFKGCNTSDNLLNVQKPSWEKFVMVNSEDVLLYKEPSATSSKLMWAMENIESDMCDFQFRWEDQGKKRGYIVSNYELAIKAVMPVLEDVGGWYKVQVEEPMAGVTEAYINKKWCKEVVPQPITEDILERVDRALYRCDYVVKDGNMKGLCLSTSFQELEGELFMMGQMMDGVLIYPETQAVYINHNTSSGMSFKKNEDFAGGYILTYGADRSFKIDSNPVVFNTRSLTAEEVEYIYQSIKIDSPKSFEAYYYFPEAGQDRLISFSYSLDSSVATAEAIDDRPEEGVKNYTVKGEEGEQQLMAELDEEQVFVGVANEQISIIHEEDFDGDGYNEALVSETCNGHGCIPEIYVVYYDKYAKEFKQTNRCESYIYPEIETWNEKTSFVQSYGVRKDRYIYEDYRIKQVEKEVQHVGKTLKKWTRLELFEESEAGEKVVSVDIDGDGIDETLVFGHNDSFACGNGRDMFVDKIKWQDGRSLGDEYFGLRSASSFALLENSTNGMHDLLLNDAYPFRWNGTAYEEWEWDGEKLVKSQNEPLPQDDDIDNESKTKKALSL